MKIKGMKIDVYLKHLQLNSKFEKYKAKIEKEEKKKKEIKK